MKGKFLRSHAVDFFLNLAQTYFTKCFSIEFNDIGTCIMIKVRLEKKQLTVR